MQLRNFVWLLNSVIEKVVDSKTFYFDFYVYIRLKQKKMYQGELLRLEQMQITVINLG